MCRRKTERETLNAKRETFRLKPLPYACCIKR